MSATPKSSRLHVLAVSGLAATTALAALAASPRPGQLASPAAKLQASQNYGKLPLSFEANHGQVDSRAKFVSRGKGYSLFLTGSAAVLSLSKDPSGSMSKGDCHPERSKGSAASAARLSHNLPPCAPAATDTIQMQLAGANLAARVEGQNQLPGVANYFLGNNPAKWRANIPTYAKVRYTGVYNGIDLVYYGNQSQLEYDFVVAPNADPKPIRLQFAGAKKLALTRQGDLEVTGKNGQIAFHKPVLYQESNGQRQPIEGSFTLQSNNTVSFKIGRYDQAKSLVIDPILTYSTYLGGSTNDWANAIAVDSSGDAYIAGTAYSTDFPLKSPFQKTNNASALAVSNVFVSKLNPSGTALLYSTYLGGNGAKSKSGNLLGDSGNAIAVDASGDAYITGAACSANFPLTKNAFQAASNGSADQAYWQDVCNAFVTKLNPAGATLLYSTYLGGSGAINDTYNAGNFNAGDAGNGIAVDSQGDAYIVGTTESTDFPVTPGVIQSGNHAASQTYGSNAFVAKFNTTTGALLYSTCLGGSGSKIVSTSQTLADFGQGIAVDSSGNAYVTGTANSANFPVTKGAFQSTNKAAGTSSNVFVAKLNANATALLYSTYLGGSGLQYDGANGPSGDSGAAIALDASGHAYITGQAFSFNFPITEGAFQTTNGGTSSNFGSNAFVTELNPEGTGLAYSTYLGGSTNTHLSIDDYGSGIAVDAAGDAYVTGTTQSSNFPTTANAYQNANSGTANPFVTKLNPTGTALIYSTYLGGSAADYGFAIALDSTGNAYTAGLASSSNFPLTAGAFQTTNKAYANKGSNAFIARLSIGGETTTAITSSANPDPQGSAVTLTAKVAAPYSASNPTGTVAFTIDGNLVATVPVASGVATYSTTTLGLGKHTVIALYSGATGYQTSESVYYQSIGIATPVLSPAAGTYETPQQVTITDATPGAAIYYTTNGANPSATSTLYTGAISVSTATTVKAIAVLSGYSNSTIASAAYNIKPGTTTPTITPAGGTGLTEAPLVTIADTATGAVIYYTTNGTIPTGASTKYTVPFLVGVNETVTAIAIAPNDSPSTPKTASFTFAAAPTILSGPATAITASSATLNAFTSTQGLSGTYYFQYGVSATVLSSTTAKTALNSLPTVQVSAALSGLKTKTVYYYQFVVTTAAGSVLGPVLSFTTN